MPPPSAPGPAYLIASGLPSPAAVHGAGRAQRCIRALIRAAGRYERSPGQTGGVELGVFDQVDDGLRALVPADLGTLHTQARRWGVKAWFDVEACPRAHYEAQVIGAKHVPGAAVLAIEVGFHVEHPHERDNVEAMAAIVRAEPTWRAALGSDAVTGAFLGRGGWLRLSETWIDPDLSDPELCFEVADRLAAYVTTIEPLRRGVPAPHL